MSKTTRIAAAVLLAALALTGCSAGGKPAQQSTSDPSVSTPVDEQQSPAPDFATAIKFTKLVHKADLDGFRAAAALTKPESAAARYLAHQTLMFRAEKIRGGHPADAETPSIKADPIKQTITIRYHGQEGVGQGKAVSYTWRDFSYGQGKVTGWTGASGPIGSVLWTRQTFGESGGRKAVLKSAYLSNDKSMNIVVEPSSSRGTTWGNAEYNAKGGYRQTATDQGAGNLSKGEKTLGYFIFEDAKFGGTLHIPYYDADGTVEGSPELVLAIK